MSRSEVGWAWVLSTPHRESRRGRGSCQGRYRGHLPRIWLTRPLPVLEKGAGQNRGRDESSGWAGHGAPIVDNLLGLQCV